MPGNVPEAAASVKVLTPLPGAVMLAGVKGAVTPCGNPLTDNATADWNPYSAAVDSLTVVEPPGATSVLVALGVSVKVGGVKTARLIG